MSRWIISLVTFTLAAAFAFGQGDANASDLSTSSLPSRQEEPHTAPTATLSHHQIKELIQKVADNDLENNKKLHDYVYVGGDVQRFTQGTETEEDVLNRARGEVRLRYRLRF